MAPPLPRRLGPALFCMLLLGAAGCRQPEGVFCEGQDQLEPGDARALVDGVEYSTDGAFWSSFTNGLFVNMPETGGISLEIESNAWLPGLARGDAQTSELGGNSRSGSLTVFMDGDRFETDSSDVGRVVFTEFTGDGGTLTGCFFATIDNDLEVASGLFMADTP